MIKLLKNKEVRKALLWQLLLSAAACAVCFFFDIRAGLTSRRAFSAPHAGLLHQHL
mgnify:CR=1 FL=1